MLSTYSKKLLVFVAITLLAACEAPSSGDGVSRGLVVYNDSNAPVIGFSATVAGTTTSFIDRMPGTGYIRPGRGRTFNLDDGQGTCMFDLRARSADRVFYEALATDVCQIVAEGNYWMLGNVGR